MLKITIQIIILELAKLESIVEKPACEMNNPERWGVYLEYLTDRSKRSIINEIVSLEEGIAMASSVLMTISRDEEERARIMRAEKTELDYISFMAHAKEVGLEQGIAQGRKNALSETAIKMREIGLTAEQILAVTGLAPEAVVNTGS